MVILMEYLNIDCVSEKYLKLYYDFFATRHNLWVNRFVKKLPQAEWTDDPIMKEFKFTNAYRELDRGTLYYTEVMVPQCHNEKDLLLNTLVYKMFNKVETQQALGHISVLDGNKIDLPRITNILENMTDQGLPVFTNAHMVQGMMGYEISPSEQNTYGRDIKCNRIMMGVVKDFLPNIDNILKQFEEAKTFKDCFNICCSFLSYGLGDFIGYEILVHLSMAGFFKRFTINDWANPGPGAMKAISAIMGNPVNTTKVSYKTCEKIIKELYENQEYFFNKFNIDVSKFPHFSMLNCENALCESSKRFKALNGSGRPRVSYDLNSVDHSKSTESYLQLLNKNKDRLHEFYLG